MIELAKEIENCIDKDRLVKILEENGFVGNIKIHINGEYKPVKIELTHFSKMQ